MARGAALLMLGRTADGRQALHLAIRAALACGVDWTAAVSEVMLAQSLLASGDPALPVLRDALRRFRREGARFPVTATRRHRKRPSPSSRAGADRPG
jgi:hypothetical protein